MNILLNQIRCRTYLCQVTYTKLQDLIQNLVNESLLSRGLAGIITHIRLRER